MDDLGRAVDGGLHQPAGQANICAEHRAESADRVGGVDRLRQHETDDGSADALDELGRSAFGDHLARRQHADAVRALVERIKPDVVIVATGSRATQPPIDGITLPHVLSADEVLEGRPVAGRAVVLGASGTGCEVAERLLAEGVEDVTIVARGKRYARSIEPLMRRIVRERLDQHHVRVMLSTDVVRITAGHVLCRGDDGNETSLPADAVVVARGYAPDDELLKSLEGGAFALHALGDCVEVRRIRIAIREAHVVATGI